MKALPGIYEDLSFEDYRAIDAFNQSGCLQLLKCPARFRYDKLNQKNSSTKEFGQLLHSALLEAMFFHPVVMPSFDLEADLKDYANPKATKRYKELVADFEKRNADKLVIDSKTSQSLDNIKLSLNLYPDIKSLLDAPGKSELTLVWNDSSTGLLCKARIDKALMRTKESGAYYLIDLKTTDSAANTDFSFSAGKFGYYVQAAHYLAGAEALGLLEMDASFLHIVIERDAPHLISCFELDEQDIERGRKLLGRCMAIYKKCLEAEEWPGYPDGIQPLNLTKSAREWADRQVEF